jgi:hypothetical protein
MPSAIYWSGLRRWGIRAYSGSVEQLIRTMDARHRFARSPVRDDDGELVDGLPPAWNPYLPRSPEGFPDEPLTFDLTADEAEFLRDRVRAEAGGSMLDMVLEPEIELSSVAFPWHHPDLASFPAGLQERLHHAQRFSEAMHGAALLYNLLLARQKGVDDWAEGYEDRLASWAADLDGQAGAHVRWDRTGFWSLVFTANPRVHPFAQRFVTDWAALLDQHGFHIENNKNAAELVARRERELKGPQARLGNQRALDNWTGASGDRQYDFRWRNARIVAADIRAGFDALEEA